MGMNDEIFNKVFKGSYHIITDHERHELSALVSELYSKSSDEQIYSHVTKKAHLILASRREKFNLNKINTFFIIENKKNFDETTLYQVRMRARILTTGTP